MSFIYLNREGAPVPSTGATGQAKDAKGLFCWFVMVLEERPQYNLPELPQMNTQRVPGSTGQAGQAGFTGFPWFMGPATLLPLVGSHHVCRIFSSSGEQGLEKGLTIVIPRQVNPSCISSLIRRRQ